MNDDIWFCSCCGQECSLVKVEEPQRWFWASECCLADYDDEPQYDNSTFANHSGKFAEND